MRLASAMIRWCCLVDLCFNVLIVHLKHGMGIHIAINQPQNNDLQEQALSQLDVVLILLMSAVDVAARVAHRVLGLSSDEHSAGWQRKKWLKEVGTKMPAL